MGPFDFLEDVANKIEDFGEKTVRVVEEGVEQTIETVALGAETVGDVVVDTAEQTGETVGGAVVDAADTMADQVADVGSDMLGWAGDAAGEIQQAANELDGKVGAFIADIRNAFDTAESVVTSVRRLIANMETPPPVIQRGSYAFSFLNQRWMEDRADQISAIPLNHLTMLGTHDSGTWGIDDTRDVSPDAPEMLRNTRDLLTRRIPDEIRAIGGDIPIIDVVSNELANAVAAVGYRGEKYIMASWAKTQDTSLYEQLMNGARYLDIRVCKGSSPYDGFWIMHGQYSIPFTDLLDGIAQFVSEHPREIVLLDISQFKDCQDADCEQLATDIYDAFGDLLALKSSLYPSSTVQSYWDAGQTIVVIYEHSTADNYDFLWNKSLLDAPWKSVKSVTEIDAVIAERCQGIQGRQPDTNNFFVTQCVLTPDDGGDLIIEGALKNAQGRPDSLQALATQLYPLWCNLLNVYGQFPYANIFMVDWFTVPDHLMAMVVAANELKATRP